MHLIRRSALRAVSSTSTSFASKPRAITTSSPFVLRAKTQSTISTSVFRRFNSDEARSSTEPADGESGSVKQAINSASETASSYVSDAAQSVGNTAGRFANEVSETAASAFGGRRYEDRRPNYGGQDRGYGGGYGGQDRGHGGMDRGGSRFPRSDAPRVPTNGVYIGNLIFDATPADLEREFQQFGTVKNAVVATDARGLSKGFGYIEFETVEEAARAIEARNQTVWDGRRIVVNYQVRTNREPRQNEPSKTLFVGNLAFEMSDADLNKLFRDIKNVIDVRVAIDRRTGQPRGFAHADFIDIESAVKGKELLTGKEVYGRTLRVDFSSGSRSREPLRE